MINFTVEKIKAVKGKQDFEQLVIAGVGQWDEFENALKNTNYETECRTLLTYMSFIAECRPLPKTKFRDITPKGERTKEYEFKSKHLRIYAIDKLNGKIIVLCGFKTNQDSDIKRFRSLKDQYLNS